MDIRNGIRDLLALGGVFALGWALHGRTVHAAADDFQFQMQTAHVDSSLLIYHPSDKMIYVYQGAMTGNASLQCSFRYRLGDDGVVRRENCPAGSLLK
jgi:hypothetical protein